MSLQTKMPTPLRRRLSTRKCGGGIAVCCVALLSVLFFMVGMQDKQPRAKSKLESRPTGSPESSRTEGPESNANAPTPGNVDGMGHPEENGLRRYPSFEEYVRARRAEDPDSFMPVVEEGKENVTVPELIVIGARRAGTTSLFRMIGQHPDVASIVPEVYTKDSLGFMAQDPATYPNEAEWAGDKLETELPASVVGNLLKEYSRPFILAESREKGSKNQLLTVELSSGYLASPLAPYRLKIAMPDVKVVILLRDPVERYFSELREKLCNNAERDIDWDDIKASFAGISASKAYLSEAVVNFSPYDKRCLGELASPSDLWKCKQGAERSHRPLLEGLYAVQVARWLRVFDSSQIKIVDSKKLFSEPDKTAADVAKFAGLRDHTFFEFALDREASCDPRRRSQQVSMAYYKRKEAEPKFRKWYAEHNDMLAELIGKDFGWNDRIRSMNTEPSGGFLRA